MNRFIKCLLCFILALGLLVPTLPANAMYEQVSEDGKIIYFINNGDTCTIFFYAGTEFKAFPSNAVILPVMVPSTFWT